MLCYPQVFNRFIKLNKVLVVSEKSVQFGIKYLKYL